MMSTFEAGIKNNKSIMRRSPSKWLQFRVLLMFGHVEITVSEGGKGKKNKA